MRQQILYLKRDYCLYIWIIGMVLMGLSFQAAAVSTSFKDLQDAIKVQNDLGYGKTISSELRKLTILNKTGFNGDSRTFKVRTLDKYGKWSNDTQLPPGSSVTYSMRDTRQVSLNGDGSRDDLKINDTKGYIEYQSAVNADKNLWANMVTWNGESQRWLVTSLLDIVDGKTTALLPSINKEAPQIIITLIDGHNYGTTISNTYKRLRVLNSTSSYSFPIRYKNEEGDWYDDKVIGPGQQSSWHQINKTQELSLNGKDNGDNLKINDGLGYIQFNLGKATGHLAGMTSKDKSNYIWVTQVWYHPVITQWFGLGSWSNVNEQGEGSDLPSVTLIPSFQGEEITFELQAKP